MTLFWKVLLVIIIANNSDINNSYSEKNALQIMRKMN